jgi:hypothetical protein
MRQLRIALTLAAAALIPALSQKISNPFAGRWDMTVTRGDDTFPSWMELVEKDGNPQVRVQGRTGNVNPAAAVKMDGSHLIITVLRMAPARPASEDRPALPARPELIWELTAKGGKLTGTQRQGDTVWQLTGVRAPALKRAAPKAWSDLEPLFNGRDLSGWEPINNTPGLRDGPAASHWVAKNGELVNEARGANLRTIGTFSDFKLHIEYNCPPGENSGIYLRGRYEAQVTPPPAALPSGRGGGGGSRGGPGGGVPRNPYPGVGCIYGMVGPSTPPPFRPDWQIYDITLVGRWVTVVFNGVTTVDNQEIPGTTGGALDSNEAEPGPIYLQGDHHGGIRYRNITISVPKR